MLLWGHTNRNVAILVVTQKVDHPGVMKTIVWIFLEKHRLAVGPPCVSWSEECSLLGDTEWKV